MTFLDELKKKAEELFGFKKEEEKEDKEWVEPVSKEIEVDVELPPAPELSSPTYEKMEYVPKSDEEIEKEVAGQLSEYKDSAMQSYDLAYSNTKEQKEKQKVIKGDEKKEKDEKVNADYDKKSKKIDYDLIKRGMVNSSSNALLKEDNEQKRLSALDEVSAEYEQAIEKLDNDIVKAENKKDQAIAEFNISYALKYANLVSKLKQERDEMVQKAVEYNNKIAKQEFADQVTKEKTESDLYSEALDHYEQEQSIKDKQAQKVESSYEYKIYNILRKQLANMSKKDAYNAIRNDPTYAENLSTNYYLQLVDEFGR